MQQSNRPAPLATGWKGLEAKLRENKTRTEIDIELARLCFYFGGKIAVVAATRSPMSLMLMSMELRDFDRYVVERRDELTEESICPAVSIS